MKIKLSLGIHFLNVSIYFFEIIFEKVNFQYPAAGCYLQAASIASWISSLCVHFVWVHHQKVLFPDNGVAQGLVLKPQWIHFRSLSRFCVSGEFENHDQVVNSKNPFYSASRDVRIHDVIQTL